LSQLFALAVETMRHHLTLQQAKEHSNSLVLGCELLLDDQNSWCWSLEQLKKSVSVESGDIVCQWHNVDPSIVRQFIKLLNVILRHILMMGDTNLNPNEVEILMNLNRLNLISYFP